MQRQHAIGYSRNAELANSRGVRPSHYAPGETPGARMVAGVSQWEEEVEPVQAPWGNVCLAHYKGKGTL